MKFIIRKDKAYAIVETLEVNDNVFAKCTHENLSLDDAESLIEDAVPMNSAGSGHVAGIGIGPNGEPGINKRRKILRRVKLCVRGQHG